MKMISLESRSKKNLFFVTSLVIIVSVMVSIIYSQTNDNKEEKNMDEKYQVAYFAGGCFWCMEEAFEARDGIVDTISGYMGGYTQNPTYEQVSYTDTGHTETIKVIYDPKIINYQKLIELFWLNIDPIQKEGQFCDQGSQYRSAVFYSSDEEKKLFLESINWAKERLQVKLTDEFSVELAPAETFYQAEDYHQSYYKKNPIRYKYYKYSCGREKQLKKIWGKFYQKKSS